MPTVNGTSGDDVLLPIDIEDTEIMGFSGDDTLYAGGGFDTLDGGLGTDLLSYDIVYGGMSYFTNGVAANLQTGQTVLNVGGSVILLMLSNV
jgi:hypothetical protein